MLIAAIVSNIKIYDSSISILTYDFLNIEIQTDSRPDPLHIAVKTEVVEGEVWCDY